MRAHHHPDQARDGEDRPEDETRDRRLLDTRKPQVGVMAQGKHRGREQDNGYFCAGTSPKEFAEAFEQVPSENGFFSEARADNHREQYSGECSPVSYQVMVGEIDCGGAEQRHHDSFHQKIKRAAENDADGESPDPALRSHVADLTPWRIRSPGPQEYEKGAERFDNRGQDDDENR